MTLDNLARRRLAWLHARMLAAQRRRLLGDWQEQLDRLGRTPVRTDAERLAKAEALENLHNARPQ